MKKPELQTKLMAAIPALTDADFDYHASDLYVVAKPGVREWLQANNQSSTVFTAKAGHDWAGKHCFDIPFGGYWPDRERAEHRERMEATVIKHLTEAYQTWMGIQHLAPLMSADEALVSLDLTSTQYDWVSKFLALWEATQ